jgi:hypothetical protein
MIFMKRSDDLNLVWMTMGRVKYVRQGDDELANRLKL